MCTAAAATTTTQISPQPRTCQCGEPPAVGGREAEVAFFLLDFRRVAARNVTTPCEHIHYIANRAGSYEFRRLRFAIMKAGHMALLRAVAASRMLWSSCSTACDPQPSGHTQRRACSAGCTRGVAPAWQQHLRRQDRQCEWKRARSYP